MQSRSKKKLAMLLVAESLFLATQTAGAQERASFNSVMTQERSEFQRIISVGTGNTFTDTNTAVGFEPLWENTTGTYNTAFGRYSLRLNTTGRVNTALGVQTLFRNTTGSY